MRILLTVPSLAREFGGPRAKAITLADQFRSLGHEAEVIGCQAGDGSQGLPMAGQFHGTPVPRTLGPVRRAVQRTDVVHVLGYRDPVGTAAALSARKRGIPYLYEPVGMHRRRLRSLGLKWAFDACLGARLVGRAGAVVATSRLEARELVEDGVNPGRIRMRPNGVTLEVLAAGAERGVFRERIGIGTNVPIVLALGRIAAKKGLLVLLRALAELPKACVVIAGPDDGDGTLAAVESARCNLGLDGRVKVLASGLWGQEKAEALADADCFCLPSATENFGNAPAEAACLGIPVIVSDQCGVAEWLDPMGSRVVPYDDVAALAVAIRDVLEDERVKGAAVAAAPRLRETFDWSNVASQQLAIYRELVEEQKAF